MSERRWVRVEGPPYQPTAGECIADEIAEFLLDRDEKPPLRYARELMASEERASKLLADVLRNGLR